MIVKVCGLRETDNIRDVEAAGIDWAGFIFYAPSPRCIHKVPDYLPARALRIGVFVSPTFGEVTRKVHQFGLQAVQLHGDVAPELCRKLRERKLIVVRALPADVHLNANAQTYTDCVDYFLFDTPTASYGGSGHHFDWQILHSYTGQKPFLIGGGIGPDDLPALHQFHHNVWAGIDLNSRFETAPGRKDIQAITQFITSFRTI